MNVFQSSQKEQQIERFRARILWAFLLVFLGFGTLIGRFFWLQIKEYQTFQTRSEENRIALLPIAPTRGLIVDKNGIALVHNFSSLTLEVVPARVANLEQLLNDLSSVLPLSSKEIQNFWRKKNAGKRFDSIPIKTRLTDSDLAQFSAQHFRFPQVEIKARLFREYPFGKIAAHSLGYVGRVSKNDAQWIEENEQTANYKGTEQIGKTALEQHYEFDLHGKTGWEQVEIDSAGQPLRVLKNTPAEVGNNLELTLDIHLQELAEKAFGKRRGSLVAINPQTGGILALVSMPSFDPNLFVDGISSINWKNLNEHPDRPLINRAINGAYPPGSTFKPFMALAGLEYGKRTPKQSIYDPGYFVFGNHTFRDDKRGGHGFVDLPRSIVVSCDTYYYHLANDLGIDAIAQFMHPIGFGQKTGIDLGKDDSGESKGVLPSREWKRKRFKTPSQQQWYAGETISIGIGQGYNAYTPLQLASAVATLANDGVRYRPHLVKAIVNPKTGAKKLIESQPLLRLPWKKENVRIVKDAMRDVLKHGTAARVFANAGYEAAGKTGTAQVFSLKGAQYRASSLKEHLRDHALFVAYAPLDKPTIALAILVENGGFGAATAAPIAKQVLDYHLLGKTPKNFQFSQPRLNALENE